MSSFDGLAPGASIAAAAAPSFWNGGIPELHTYRFDSAVEGTVGFTLITSDVFIDGGDETFDPVKMQMLDNLG